jgi:hypothetical protein
MALDQEEQPSRWNLFIEARDTIRGVIAPRLSLTHMLENGPRIARRMDVKRPKRPLQGVRLHKVATGKLG